MEQRQRWALCALALLHLRRAADGELRATSPALVSIVPINQRADPLKAARPTALGESGVASAPSAAAGAKGLFELPTLGNIIGADNFGIPQGDGCLPVLSGLMRSFASDCQTRADERTLDSWTGQLGNVLRAAPLDWGTATKQTCLHQADRKNCRTLLAAVSRCDIVSGLKAATDLQNDKQRCERIAEIAVQPVASGRLFGAGGTQQQLGSPLAALLGGGGAPLAARPRLAAFGQPQAIRPVNGLLQPQQQLQPQQSPLLSSISNWIGSEVAHGFLRNFLG